MNRINTQFTLVEMLIVIAIIGILAALLMPAMNGALESSRELSCANNLKNIGIVSATYAGEFNGFIPPAAAYDPSANSGDFPSTVYGAAQHTSMMLGYSSGLPVSSWAVAPTDKFNPIFACPTDPDITHFPRWVPNNASFLPVLRIGYSTNSYAWAYLNGRSARYGFGAFGTPKGFHYCLRASDIRKPSQTAYFGDCLYGNCCSACGWITLTWGTTPALVTNRTTSGSLLWNGTWSGLRLGHKQETGYNTLFFDGHLSGYQYPAYPASLTSAWLMGN